MLEKYAFEFQRDNGPPTWVIDTFLDLQVPYESILRALENLFESSEAPFHGRNRRVISNDLIYVIQRWYQDTERAGGRILGGDSSAQDISQLLLRVQTSGLGEQKVEECCALRMKIEQMLR